MPLADDIPFDLFVSYAHVDNGDGWVTRLVDAIRTHHQSFSSRKLSVFFDIQKIENMHDWELRILTGLKQSKVLLAILSPAYFASPYCRKEWRVYLEHEITRAMFGQSIGAIYYVQVPWIPQGEPPPANRGWIDDIRARQFCNPEPWFDRGAHILQENDIRSQLDKLARAIDGTVVRVEQGTASPTTVPPYNRNFVGRTADLRKLRVTLEENPVGAVVGVQGIGGIGKSELAFAYAHAYADAYPGGRYLISCEGIADLRVVLVKLADQPEAGVELTIDDRDDRNLDRTAAKVRAHLIARGKSLVILDNVDRPELLAPAVRDRMLPDRRHIHLLATTREDPDRLADVVCLSVEALECDDALRLFERHFEGHRPPLTDEEFESVAGIVARLGGHPLACEVVAVHLARHSEKSCSDYLRWLDDEFIAALDGAGSDPRVQLQRNPTKLLGPLLKPTLENLSPLERTALDFAAIMPPDHISLNWLRMLVGDEFPEVAAPVRPARKCSWRETVDHLTGLRLLTVREDRKSGALESLESLYCRCHRVVQATVAAAMIGDARLQRSNALLDLIDKRREALQGTQLTPEVLREIDLLKAALVPQLAIALHEMYRYRLSRSKPSMAHLDVPFESLSVDIQNANTGQALRIPHLLRLVGLHLVPGKKVPINQLLDSRRFEAMSVRKVIADNLETLAEAEHNGWMAERVRNGWRYGRIRDTAMKIHPLIIPYSQLSEEDKNYDRWSIIGRPPANGSFEYEQFGLIDIVKIVGLRVEEVPEAREMATLQ